MMRAGGKRAAGFTLLEVLVTLVLVTTAVMAAVALTRDNLDQAAMIRRQDQAVLLARAKLFELAGEGLSASLDEDGDFDPDHPGFRWVAKASSTDEDNTYRASVRVTWDDPKRGEVRLERLFHD